MRTRGTVYSWLSVKAGSALGHASRGNTLRRRPPKFELTRVDSLIDESLAFPFDSTQAKFVLWWGLFARALNLTANAIEEWRHLRPRDEFGCVAFDDGLIGCVTDTLAQCDIINQTCQRVEPLT